MSGVALGSAVIGAAGSAYAANKASKAQKKAASQASSDISGGADQGRAMSWEDIQRVNALNRDNATWTQQQNQAAQDRNMIDSSNAWGGITRERDPVTGELKQVSSLSGPWANIVNQGANQYGAMQGGLSADQFSINNDVFKAMQALAAPQLEQQRNRENARLAAMGLGTGSGQAWQTAQEALGSNENDMFNRNVLGANQAWLAGQGNLRNNMGAIMSGQQGLKGLSQQDAWAQATAPQMTQTQVPFAPQNNAFEASKLQAELAAQQGKLGANSAMGWGSAINGLVGNKDVQAGIGKAVDWFNTPSNSQTANYYGTTPGSQQTNILNQQDAAFSTGGGFSGLFK